MNYREFLQERNRLNAEIALNTKLHCMRNVRARQRELERLERDFFGLETGKQSKHEGDSIR